jgi:hypothetical protein
LVVAGYPVEWLRYEAHVVQLAAMQTSTLGAPGLTGANAGLRYRSLDDRWRWYDGRAVSAEAMLDRLNVKLMLPGVDLTIGRQAVTFGTAYFWNPLDVFLAFDATSFDRDYKRGVDGVRIDIAAGESTTLSAVAVLGRVSDGFGIYRSALLAAGQVTLFDWDIAVQGGKVYGGMQAGLAASGELGPVPLRAEAAYFWPLPDLRPNNAAVLPEGLTAVVGTGYTLQLFERTLQVEAEYLLNHRAAALGRTERFTLIAKGLLRQASEHVLGVTLSYELTPLVRISTAALLALDDPSLLVQPGLVYSAGDNIDVVAGAMLAVGERPILDRMAGALTRSEFGSYPHIFYIETKLYF